MSTKSFLVSELEALAGQLSGVKLRYRYDKFTNEHVVEVSPKSVYESPKFRALGVELYDKFHAHCSDEWLVFITDDMLVGIDDVDGEEHTLQGADYACTESKPQNPAPARRKTMAQKLEYA
jgi:hypothetical protein